MNYSQYFKNRVLIICGVGRSGTTILGKIIGSMKNTLYFFEPAIMKYFPATESLKSDFEMICNSDLKESFLGTLFEDYILPAVQGRSLNINSNDWTYYGNYQTDKDLSEKFTLSRRSDALKWIEETNPTFVFKVNESQYLFDTYANMFEGLKIVYIYRSGYDSIASMMERGWFKNDYKPIDLTVSGGFKKSNIAIPKYLKNVEDRYLYNYQNPETRAALIWRYLNQLGLSEIHRLGTQRYIENFKLYYEELLENRNDFYNFFFGYCKENFNLEKTELTDIHIQSIQEHVNKGLNIDPKVDLNDIEESERQRFIEYNKELGYDEIA